jgi:hypothetical protein
MQCTSNKKKYEVLAFSNGIIFDEAMKELANADFVLNRKS